MTTEIGELIKRNYKNLSEFSKEADIPYGTVYDIVKGKTKFENIGVTVFIKICKALDMTVEELYYGLSAPEPKYSDPRQTALNRYYESMNEEGKNTLLNTARLMSGSPDVRTEKNIGEDNTLLSAMGA